MNGRRCAVGWAVLALLVPIVVSGVVAIVGLASGADAPELVELDSDAPTYTSLDELVRASDLIVVATVADVADGRTVTAPDDPAAGIRTRLVELDVSRALVGEPPTPLVVEEPAELLDGRPVVVDGMEPLDESEQAVWFLVAGTASRCRTTPSSTPRAASPKGRSQMIRSVRRWPRSDSMA